MDNSNDDSNTSGTESDPLDSNPAHPTSGLITVLMKLESEVLHRMCSVTSAASGKFQTASLMVSSLKEDTALLHEDLLSELCLVQCQLRGISQDLSDSISYLSAVNAYCTSIERELKFVRKQLDNARKKREQGSKKIKAHFVTLRDLCAQFNQDDMEQ